MARDPQIGIHKAWLGFLQPVGLVVSPPALSKTQVVLDENAIELQQRLREVVRHPPRVGFGDVPDPYLADFPRFSEVVLEWEPEDLAGGPEGPPLPEEIEVVLPDYGETLRPTYAVVDPEHKGSWLMLVQVLPGDTELDKAAEVHGHGGWQASPQAKLERLLREREIPVGLLCNGAQLRLVYAPRGESSGHITFPIAAMCAVPGRQMLAAMHMLLDEHRVFSAPDGRRLHDLLVESRKYQNEVSNKLADQVLGALWELLRGFQAADEAANGELLGELAQRDPQQIYGGLLTTLLRLVFLLYAEDQGLMPGDPVYAENYSVTGLYQRLRHDAGRYPDTMDQRYGAWAWLLSLFRLVYDGGGHGELHLPARHGQLFEPEAYPFLEGRATAEEAQQQDAQDEVELLLAAEAAPPPYLVDGPGPPQLAVPRLSDGVIHRVLQGLLVLDGERLSYRSLDVEQIGSVYEAMMGFEVQRAQGASLGVRPKHVVFDVEGLLAMPGGKRKKWLKDETGCDLTAKSLGALKTAETPQDVVAALGRRLSHRTPQVLAPGALYLQPGEERRRSGSHYTPRELTEPIVRTTLRPVLEGLGERPTPEQILALKVCDPAMGSGAFLVEACRQLGEQLVRAWELHGKLDELPDHAEPLELARRMVAQRCLYGVDKNPFAVNLAKLSLWLVTLAADKPFTFLDHALKCGDSLVGLTKQQIGAFRWNLEDRDWGPLFAGVQASVDEASGWRREIHDLGQGDYDQRREAWREAEDALRDARLIGDLCVAAFFGAEKDNARESLRARYQTLVDEWKAGRCGDADIRRVVCSLRSGERPLSPFHWEVEFPEVFGQVNPGFNAMVGNPPFLGGKRISTVLGTRLKEWLLRAHTGASGNTDLVAHFFRTAFRLVLRRGAFGFIATNTIAQGDTRRGGLAWICEQGGSIFNAVSRKPWPGTASVVVSVVHITRERSSLIPVLDGRELNCVSAYLVPGNLHRDPRPLIENQGISFNGCDLKGLGFLFGAGARSTPIEVMFRILEEEPESTRVIKLYVGGEDINSSPSHHLGRYVIDFDEMSEQEAAGFASCFEIVRERVRPERLTRPGAVATWPWWKFWRPRGELRATVRRRQLDTVHCCSLVSTHWVVARSPSQVVFSHKAGVFCWSEYGFGAALQSRVHEVWTRLLSSTLGDALSYSPSDCFETYPFPPGWQTSPTLEAVGQTYYDYRARLMADEGFRATHMQGLPPEGLTKTYNRFHDPDCHLPGILELRTLHAAMDRAVLDAYGWDDISTDCEFLLDYEIDEETWGNKKKPWRYRWPEAVHDEVLARLLDLNQKRAEKERLAGLDAEAPPKMKKPAKRRPRKKRQPPQGASLSLFPTREDEP